MVTPDYCQAPPAAGDPGPLAAFSAYLLHLGRSAETRRHYLSAVASWLGEAGDSRTLDPERVRRWAHGQAQGRSLATVNQRLAALRAYARYLQVAGYVDSGALAAIPTLRKRPARLVRALSDDQVGGLLAQPDLSTWLGLRDHVMLATLYQCGLKAGELARLTLGDVLADGYLYVAGARPRVLPVGDAWRGLIEAWLRRRREARPGKRSDLWVRSDGRALAGARSVWAIVDRYARPALGLACGYFALNRAAARQSRRTPWQGHYPHLLRASFAVELARRGVDLLHLAKLLGHASPDTTARYLGLDLAALKAALAHHPRACRVPDHAATE